MPKVPKRTDTERGLSRRGFLRGAGAGAAATAVLPGAALQRAEAAAAPQELSGKIQIMLNVNGRPQTVTAEPRTTLLDVLRNYLDLTGAKKVCDRGECGACTVLVDGKTVVSCMMLAVDAQGKRITTVESLAQGNRLHPLQAAFIEHDALQCGFCTPGFIMSSYVLLQKNQNPSDMEIREAVSGNICRCGTYQNMFAAIKSAGVQMRSLRR